MVEPLLKPLDALGVTDIVRKPAEALSVTVETTVLRLEAKGRAGMVQTESLTIHTLAGTIDAVVNYLPSPLDMNEGLALIIGKGDKQAPVRFSTRSLKALRDYLAPDRTG